MGLFRDDYRKVSAEGRAAVGLRVWWHDVLWEIYYIHEPPTHASIYKIDAVYWMYPRVPLNQMWFYERKR